MTSLRRRRSTPRPWPNSPWPLPRPRRPLYFQRIAARQCGFVSEQKKFVPRPSGISPPLRALYCKRDIVRSDSALLAAARLLGRRSCKTENSHAL